MNPIIVGTVGMLPMVLLELGLRVPEDCPVVSLHSAELGRQFAIPYTAVESQPERVATKAVETLARRLSGHATPAETILVPPVLTVRNSVASAIRAPYHPRHAVVP